VKLANGTLRDSFHINPESARIALASRRAFCRIRAYRKEPSPRARLQSDCNVGGAIFLESSMKDVRTAALFVVCSLVLLVGCGGGTPPTTGGTPATGGAKEDTLAKIKKEGVLKWGADAEGGAPFVFRDKTDTNLIIGFEVEIMDKLAAHMGVKHERVQAEWGQLIPALLSRRSDIVVNGIEINDERKQAVGFSAPYYAYEQQLTVRAEDKDKYKTLADLKGHKVGTLSDAEANNVLKRAGFTEDQIVAHPDSTLPYTNLGNKRVDAVMQENIIAAYYAAPKPELFNIPQTMNPGTYSVATRLEDKTLLAEVDRILKLMQENGELAAIYKKWNIWTEKQKDLGIKEK